ncbi:hypothetical protein MSAN_01976300 [Mycena sanguinolenta]|uniref:Transmembrane protein n=1 Tax=Mycena sanguinolenta TaxID=230812 RepID=A0A8H7CQ97_9AGAR|nr:hypothetical protein MSAN_01976300 [Mycena sanguinolenta]
MTQILDGIKSFRLGYAEERPYPWRWTTPIVVCAFLLISPFLAVVNVPLSAYNIVQEFTYQPNDTLPAVFLGNLVPSVLQNPTDSFTPQLLNVGETIVLHDSIFNYTISQAFDGVDTSKPVSTFPYFNNPLSDGCDVANLTIQVQLTNYTLPGFNYCSSKVQASGIVVCYVPTLFYLTWSGLPLDEFFQAIRNIPRLSSGDIESIFYTWSGPDPSYGIRRNLTQGEIGFTVHPCCDCDAVLAGAPLERGASLLKSPCSSNPPGFVVVEIQPLTFSSESGDISVVPLPSLPMQIADLLAQSSLESISFPLGIACENLFQTFYHLIRLDLGVIVYNQIYNSPQMFNRTIGSIDTGEFDSWANAARNLTFNAMLMVQWLEEVEFFQNNTRVPPLEYLRSVPRLKPVGSAVTSVFVSTFAMLSVMWTVFSLVAGVLARAHGGKVPDDTTGKKHTLEQSRMWKKKLESGMDEVDESEVILLGHQTAVDPWREMMEKNEMRMRVALVHISAALKKHGLMEDDAWVQDNETAVE